MSTFYLRLEEICKEYGLKPNPVCKELDISSGTITGWKKGALPNAAKLEAIADYFNISTDWLLGRTENKYSHLQNNVPNMNQGGVKQKSRGLYSPCYSQLIKNCLSGRIMVRNGGADQRRSRQKSQKIVK